MPEKQGYDGLDTFISGVGTVRECINCAALIRGGPTRCMHCAKEWVRLGNRINGAIVGRFWDFYWRTKVHSFSRRMLDKLLDRSTELPTEGDPR